MGVHVFSRFSKRGLLALTSALLATTSSLAFADDADKAKIRELETMMSQMRSQIKTLSAAVNQTRVQTRVENRRTREKLQAVAARQDAVPAAAYPPNVIPSFVTADKKFHFGSITVTPGGFLAAESVFRSRYQQADISSNYQAIPFGPLAGMNEYRFTARQSRVAALIEAPITPTTLASAYGEFDFLGAGVTSNSNESNSYAPRIRHLYGTLDFENYGLHMLAGQTWSLATMNSKGITPRNEVTPPTIEAQYVPGFTWKRQAQIRLTKDFDKRLWLAVSAEEAQTTFASACAAGVNGTTVSDATGVGNSVTCALAGTGNLTGTNNYSMNHLPDVVGKVAYEAHLADRDVHLEGFGMYRDLFDRVAYTNTFGAAQPLAANKDTTGWGVGGGLIVPVLPKRLEFQASGTVGRGIGSYGTAQFGDATFNPDGSLSPLREEMVLAGLTAHVTSAIDLYAFGGLEQVHRDYYAITTAAGTSYAGYGVPTANNSGCYNSVNFSSASCAGNAQRIWQITGGFWDKLYKGAYGEVRAGVQYSYTERQLFSGTGATAPATAYAGSPRQNEQMVLTSFRYYPFQ